jgi:hypothetical protein
MLGKQVIGYEMDMMRIVSVGDSDIGGVELFVSAMRVLLK